jgi:alkylhydroperoxidase/carboxymuconolactone decarboxylase family protein YurZ
MSRLGSTELGVKLGRRRRGVVKSRTSRTAGAASFASRDRLSLSYDARSRHAGETAMAENELYKRGEAIRRRLRGDADFIRNKREYDTDPVMKKFIDVATETVFGALWARPGLDFKTRTLICVVADAATGRHPELDIRLRLALKQDGARTSWSRSCFTSLVTLASR